MLWLRGLIFTVLVPGAVGIWVPGRMRGSAAPAGGWWQAGWLLAAAGALLYGWCLLVFLLSGGTPAPFFTRHLSWVLGKEPPGVVARGPYRFSRNPMYLAVVAAILGQSVAYRSAPLLVYAVAVFVTFHLVVTLLEEPHLGRARGAEYQAYLDSVGRWMGRK
jgi:protein-S-isoprenylcysteine O-methyltransferase Ste14